MNHEFGGRRGKVLKTHNFRKFLKSNNPAYQREILAYTLVPLLADLKEKGDLTTQLLLSKNQEVKAIIRAKSEGLLAGIEELEYFLNKKWPKKKPKPFGKIRLQVLKKDGDHIKKNQTIASLTGKASDILKVERVMLNLLQRMSGIATLTHQYVAQVPSSVLVTPTRKTLWGLIDKKACVVGGGGTHRFNLSDAVLVKDTHLDLLNHDLENVFQKLAGQRRRGAKDSPEVFGRFLEIEVENGQEALEIAHLYKKFKSQKIPFFIMFDNFKPAHIKKTINTIKKRKLDKNIFFEASGGINLKNITAYATSGVDILSIGALTHSAPALDFSLKIKS